MSKPDCPKNGPYTAEYEEGSYWWCACGKSQKQPLCDGSHKDTGFEPVEFRITEKSTLQICGCKKTKNPPYCDGSHNH